MQEFDAVILGAGAAGLHAAVARAARQLPCAAIRAAPFFAV